MDLKKCYIIESEDVKKILLEITLENNSIGSNFYELKLKKVDNSYKIDKIEMVEKPFEYLQKLVTTESVREVFLEENKQKMIKIFNYYYLQFEKEYLRNEFLQEKEKIKEKNYNDYNNYNKFSYNYVDDFYQKNGIDIGYSKTKNIFEKKGK